MYLDTTLYDLARHVSVRAAASKAGNKPSPRKARQKRTQHSPKPKSTNAGKSPGKRKRSPEKKKMSTPTKRKRSLNKKNKLTPGKSSSTHEEDLAPDSDKCVGCMNEMARDYICKHCKLPEHIFCSIKPTVKKHGAHYTCAPCYAKINDCSYHFDDVIGRLVIDEPTSTRKYSFLNFNFCSQLITSKHFLNLFI